MAIFPLIMERYRRVYVSGLFIARHLQPRKLTDRFGTRELRLDPEDNLTRQRTEGASTALAAV